MLKIISFRVLATTDFNINKKGNGIPGDKQIFLLVLYITKHLCEICKNLHLLALLYKWCKC